MSFSSENSDQSLNTARKSALRTKLFVSTIISGTLILTVPVLAHAGLLSKFVEIINPEPEEDKVVDQIDYSPINTPLLSANRIDPGSATGGGDIIVTNDTLVAAAPVTEAEREAFSNSNNGEISVYTVRNSNGRPDTLSEIAEMYGVTTNTIMWANDISDPTSIQPGDVLVILPIVGVRHTVADGETLASIVKEYDADLDEVLEYNNLASADALSVDDELIIPGGSIETTVTYAARPTPTKSSGGGSALGFSHPAPGAVRTQGLHGYNGVDYGAAHGSPIRAAAAGEVIVSKAGGWNGGYGNYIVIRHGNGTQTLYAHLSANYVGVGEWVAAAQNIGAMGNTGRSTGTHLHFEVRGASNPF